MGISEASVSATIVSTLRDWRSKVDQGTGVGFNLIISSSLAILHLDSLSGDKPVHKLYENQK